MILSQAMQAFLVAMTAEGRCKRCYRDGMSAFLAHAGDVELNQLSTKTMRSFLASEFNLRRFSSESESAISVPDLLRRFYAVRTFISWLVLQGIIRDFDGLKRQKKRPDNLMVKKIFRHARGCRKIFFITYAAPSASTFFLRDFGASSAETSPMVSVGGTNAPTLSPKV